MEQQAADILRKNIYANVATATANAEPCNSPVYIVYDEELRIYWASGKMSQHSRNLLENPRAFLTVYDSTVPLGTGIGVYMQGETHEVTDMTEITRACQLRQARVSEATQTADSFTAERPRSIYVFMPAKAWLNQGGQIDGHFVDQRTELDLQKLREIIAS